MFGTGYLYDPFFLAHETGDSHPESSQRLEMMHTYVSAAPRAGSLLWVSSREASREQLCYVHSPRYVESIEAKCGEGFHCIDNFDTMVCEQSFNVARRAVGGVLEMCDYIVSGEIANGFCAIRPPGHHAESDTSSGFCLVNNIAIAARYLQLVHGIGRVAIIDWDAHHGNGTQQIFEEDPSVLYISLHQYPFFPGTGHEIETGTGLGTGYTLNIPMEASSRNRHYMNAFDEKVLPALEQFKPEFILISSGFDAHCDDDLSSLRLTTDSFYTFTMMLRNIACKYSLGRMVALLEGGYCARSMAESSAAVISALQETG